MNKSRNSAHNHATKQNWFYVVEVPHNPKSHCEMCTLCFTAVKSKGVTGLLKHILWAALV